MYCSKCGSYITEEQSYCRNCGAAIRPATEQSVIPTINQQFPVRRNGFAAVGFVLGVASIGLFWFPIINVTFAPISLVFSIIALTKRNSGGKTKAIVSIVLAAIGLYISVSFNNTFFGSSNKSSSTPQSVVSVTTNEGIQVLDSTAKISDENAGVEKPSSEEESDKKAFIGTCSDMDFDEVYKNPDKYAGKNFKCVCYIFSVRQTDQNDGIKYYYLSYMFDYDKAKARVEKGISKDLSDTKEYCKDYSKTVWLLDTRNDIDPESVKLSEKTVVVIYGTFSGLADSKNILSGEKDKKVALNIKYADILAN